MQRHKVIPSLLIIVVVALLSLVTVNAQSGRRAPKSVTLPPVQTPTPETVVPVSKEKTKPALTLVVGLERSNYFGNNAMVNDSAALLALVDRLDDHPGVDVAHVARTMARSDAIRRAKSEQEAYVVFVELAFDRMANELRLSYWVYSPQTAKIKTSGQTYPQMYRNRNVILNPRQTIYGDRELQEAAREIAERVLKSFQLHVPNGRLVL
ncbi:MAG TPA: hypothetical protein VJV03_01885 [Pyrinomonadaceae bacterium]|nr:hypothetical protein [Pyrinomonadaceae bacterium]